MATCPICHDFLDEGHHCPLKVLVHRGLKRLGIAVFGGVAAALVVRIFSSGADILLLTVSFVFGAFVVSIVWRTVAW